MNTQRELATRRGANGLAIVTTVTAIFAGVRGGGLAVFHRAGNGR